ncbi:MAG TPA: hypothetical protein VFR81_06330 [Longimicrobium sp.]|nr:hypothetical protein [Longimicrobium sp.]
MRAFTRGLLPLAVLGLTTACADRSSTAPGPGDGIPTVRIARGSMGGWTTRVGGASAASFDPGSAPQALGKGAAAFRIGTAPGDEVSFRNEEFVGTRLGDLTALGYRTFLARTGPGGLAPHVVLPVDLDGNGSIDDHLLFRPQATPGRWESWDALQGGWWSTSDIGGPDERGIRSLGAYVAAAPGARIASAIVVGAWDTRSPMSGSIDGIVIGVRGNKVMYDFEP